jgi:predicted metal-binding membrane protein
MYATLKRVRLVHLPAAGVSTHWLALGLALAAWLAILAWPGSPYGHSLGHPHHPVGRGAYAISIIVFGTAWTLMIIAMMLPTASALFKRFDRVVRRRPERWLLVGAVATGFVVTWLMVGFFFWAAQSVVQAAVTSAGLLGNRPEVVGGGVLVAAGLYQFTPMKYRCLDACRSPQSFVYRYWRGGDPGLDAFRIGVSYGVSCVGCCWMLMVVLFGLGLTSLIWMFGVATVMAIEKTASFGPRLVKPVGGLLLAFGIVSAVAD